MIPPTTPDPEQVSDYSATAAKIYNPPVQPSRSQRFWRHPITRIILFTIITVLIVIIAAIGWVLVDMKNATGMLANPTKQPGLLITEAITAAASIIAYIIMTLTIEGRSMSSTGFTRSYMARDLTLGLLLGGGLMSLVVGVLALFGVYRPTGWGSLGTMAGIWLLTFLFTAIFEETTFRAYILRLFAERLGSAWGLVISSIIFGLVHLSNPTPGLTTMQHIVGPVFISLEAGLLMGAVYIWTRRIWMSIGLHWAWNFFEGPVFGTGVSGIPAPSFINAHIKGPFILTGGAFGPEASLPCLIICTLVAVLVIRRAKRDGKWEVRTPPQPVNPSFPSAPAPLS